MDDSAAGAIFWRDAGIHSTLTVHYGDSLAVECSSVVHSFLRCIVGLNECTREHPLWFRTPLKMAVPSNSALFEGIGGDFRYSQTLWLPDALHLTLPGIIRFHRNILKLHCHLVMITVTASSLIALNHGCTVLLLEGLLLEFSSNTLSWTFLLSLKTLIS